MKEGLSLLDAIRVIANQWYVILLSTLLFGGSTFLCVKKMQPWYGHSVLIRIPAFRSIGEVSKIGVEALGKSSTGNKEIKSEISAYLDYHYLENKTLSEIPNRTEYLKSVNLLSDTEFIELIGWGTTQDNAKKATLSVVNDLERLFSERVKRALLQKKNTLEFSELAIQKMLDQLAFIDKGLDLFGVQANLLAEKASIQVKLIEANKEKLAFESKSDESSIRPLAVVADRPVKSLSPIFPRMKLFTGIGGMIGLVLSLFFTLITALIRKEDEDYLADNIEYLHNNRDDRAA